VLPPELRGPGKTIAFESPDAFLAENVARFPNLDPDFILQICFEHPARFDELLPRFDPVLNSARRTERTAGWLYENVRYRNDEANDFWSEQFDSQFDSGKDANAIFTFMKAHGTWPFPPVIVEAALATELGASAHIGHPYHLIEGTHRVSYLRRMLQRELVAHDSIVQIIEVLQ
jgi:hypothetical protein